MSFKIKRNMFVAAVLILLMILIGVSYAVSENTFHAAAWSGEQAIDYESGNGSEETPYIIANAEQLAYFAAQVNGGNTYSGAYLKLKDGAEIVLGEDIIANSASSWTPIGYFNTETAQGNAFAGNFNGNAENGAVIKNLYINSNETKSAGLFGYVESGAVIDDLKITGYVSISAANYVGAVAGYNKGTVSNSAIDCTVTLTGDDTGETAGGITAVNSGEISNCSIKELTIGGYMNAGGIAGVNGSEESGDIEGTSVAAKITDCSISKSEINVEQTVGGYVAHNSGIVEKVLLKTNDSFVLSGSNVGGIVGDNDSAAKLKFAAINGTLTISGSTVGTVVSVNGGSIEDCVFKGFLAIQGEVFIFGGIAGINDGSILGSYYLNLDSAQSIVSAGGIVGENNGTVQNSFFKGKIYGKTNVGGIAAINRGRIENTLVVGITDESGYGIESSADGYAGGIVGRIDGGEIKNSLVLSNVASGAAYRGAVVGDGTGTFSGVYYDSNAFFHAEVPSGISASSITALTASEFLPSAGWSVNSSNLPTLKYFSSYATAEFIGITDFYAEDMSNACAVGDRAEITVDETPLTVLKSLNYALPVINKSGYNFKGWSDGASNYSPNAEIKVNGEEVFTSIWEIKSIELISQSTNMEKVFDNATITLSATFSHELSMAYSWYYSANGIEYTAIQGVASSSIEIKFVADSGYYYCVATVTDGAISTSLQTENIAVKIEKATYSGITHASINGGKYTGKSLSEFSLNDGFYWTNPDNVATVTATEYAAYYNADPDNYNNFNLIISLTLEKGDYSGITHADITGGKYSRKNLSAFSLEENYRWFNQFTVPTVDNTDGYLAYYNADSDNYNDYELYVKVVLEKGDYENITHPSLSGTYSNGATLNKYQLQVYFSWSDPTVVPTVDVNSYSAVYCEDSINYNPFELKITINISQAEPTINPSVAAGVYFEGDPMPSLSKAVGDTKGRLEWGEYETLGKGNVGYVWKFTPEDEVNYKTAEGEIFITATELLFIDLRVTVQPKTIEYTAFSKFSVEDMVITAYYNNGRSKAVLDYSLSYENDTDSFRYGDVKITINYTDCGETRSVDIEVTVKKIEIDIPVDNGEHYYDGELKTAAINSTEFYTATGNTGITVGKYTVTVTLLDSDNYCWKGNENVSVNIPWEILKRSVSLPTINRTYTYSGREQTCEIETNYLYEARGNRQTLAGVHTVTVSLQDVNNNCWSDGSTADKQILWTIGKVYLAAPVAIQKEYVYTGETLVFEYVNAVGMLAVGDRQTDAGIHTVTFRLANENYAWASGGETATLVWEIKPKKIKIPVVTNTVFVYDGEEKNLIIPYNAAYTATGTTKVNSDDYEAVVTLTGSNYIWDNNTSDPIRIAWKIEKLSVNIPVMGDTMPIYNGSELTAPLAESARYNLSGNREIEADSYLALATLTDVSNLIWSDGTSEPKEFQWSIGKRELELPKLTTVTYRYTGEAITAIITADSACVIEGNTGTVVAEYSAEVSLPNGNYIWSDKSVDKKIFKWNISPAIVQRPTVLGDSVYSPTGQNAAISLSDFYTVRGNTGINVAEYTATVVLNDKNNYVWDNNSVADLNLKWRIVKAQVEIPVKEKDLIYDGRAQSVRIIAAAECNVTGINATEAGSYIATVSLKDSANYVWSDGTSAPKEIAWNIFAINFSAGEEVNLSDVYVAGTPLPIPVRDNYIFEGWYASADFSGERISVLTEIDSDIVLYAKWTEDTFGDSAPVKNDTKKGLSTKAIIGLSVLGVCAAIAVCLIIYAVASKGSGKKRYRD